MKYLPEKDDRDQRVGGAFYNELNHRGKVAIPRGVPYITLVRANYPPLHLFTELGRFQAMVMYLYTGEIDFAPFGSEANRKLRAPELLSTAEDKIPRPSPKSVFRIADMVSATDVATLSN